MIKRIITLVLVLSLVCTSLVFAEDRSLEELYDMYMSDVVDIERVHKYDMSVKEKVAEGGEVLEYKNAVNAVVALGLMSYLSDGTFNESGAVPLRDFANIIMTLMLGSTTVFENNYEDYPENRYTTQDEAAYYLVGVLGYEDYAARYSGENARSMVAMDLDLFDGITYSGSKNITRGELSQMLLNALTTEIVTPSVIYNEATRHEIDEDNTLIYNRYDSVIVEGIVTSQYGINIDSGVKMRANTIAIDGAKYYLDTIEAPDLLAHKAFAVAKIEAGGYHLLAIDYAQDDETVRVNIADIDDVRKGSIYYKDASGNEQSADIDRLSKIVVNDTVLTTTDLESVLFDYEEGELRLCTSRNAARNFAYISVVNTYKVFGISLDISEKIILDHNATYKGNGYIDFAGKDVYVTKNGAEATLADVTTGSIISIIENANETELRIMLSDTVISGMIEAIDGDIYYINGEPYKLASCYESFCETDASIPVLTVGTTGDFALDYAGRIVGFESKGTTYRFGYLKALGNFGGGLNVDYRARIYTTDNEWKEYALADTLTLDGISGVTAQEAFESMQSYGEGIHNIIRYRLSNDEIKFLDTVQDLPEEAGDLEAVRYHGSWTGTFNWTASSKGYKSIGSYVGSSSSQVFNIPADANDEDEYSYEASPSFTQDSDGELKMYNVDEFMMPSVIIRVKGGSADYAGTHKFAVVTKLLQGIDEDGEPALVVECFDGSTTPTWKLRKFIVSPSIADRAKNLVPGDVLLYAATKDELTGYEVTVKASEWNDDIEVIPGGSYTKGIGTVLAVDPARKYVRMRAGNAELTVYIHSLGLYNSADGKTYNISPGEIEVGDRIFIGGGYGYMRCLILR